jgi:hypothetical protein
MKHVYILQMVIETDDEVKMEIDSVFTTKEKAEAWGKHLVENNEECIGHYVSKHMIYQ